MSSAISSKPISGTYTLLATDNRTILEAVGNVTLTIPNDATASWPADFFVLIAGDGAVTTISATSPGSVFGGSSVAAESLGVLYNELGGNAWALTTSTDPTTVTNVIRPVAGAGYASAAHAALTSALAAPTISGGGFAGMTPAQMREAAVAPGLEVDNVFSGKLEINAPDIPNPFPETDLYITSLNPDPVDITLGVYVQHRVSGDSTAGPSVDSLYGAINHEAIIGELRMRDFEGPRGVAVEASVVISGDTVDVGNDLRALTANVHFEDEDTEGAIDEVIVISSQRFPSHGPLDPDVPPGVTVGTVIGLLVEEQNQGETNNWSILAPGTAAKSKLEGRLIVGPADHSTNFDGQIPVVGVRSIDNADTLLTLQGTPSQAGPFLRLTRGTSNSPQVMLIDSNGAVHMRRNTTTPSPDGNSIAIWVAERGAGVNELAVRYSFGDEQVLHSPNGPRFSRLRLQERATTPATPAAGEAMFWVNQSKGVFVRHDDGTIERINNAAPSAASYTATNVTVDRTFDADTATIAEVADVLGTLISDLKLAGVLPS